MSLATAIRNLRKENNISVQDLAAATGLPVYIICDIEWPPSPSAEVVNRLAEAFGMTRLELLTKAED